MLSVFEVAKTSTDLLQLHCSSICQEPFVHGDLVVYCPRCSRPQHVECWDQRGERCGDASCMGSGQIDSRGRGAAIGQVRAAQQTSSIVITNSRQVFWYIGLGVLLLLAGVWVGGGMLERGQGSKQSTAQGVTLVDQQSYTLEATATPRPTSRPLVTPSASILSASSRRAVVSCEEIFVAGLRRTPGYISKNASDYVIRSGVPCDEYVEIIGESRQVDGLTWWQVRWNGYTGWMADHTGSGKIILVFEE